jgi:hypothetical protein
MKLSTGQVVPGRQKIDGVFHPQPKNVTEPVRWYQGQEQGVLKKPPHGACISHGVFGRFLQFEPASHGRYQGRTG